jgi:hypothetical protein
LSRMGGRNASGCSHKEGSIDIIFCSRCSESGQNSVVFCIWPWVKGLFGLSAILPLPYGSAGDRCCVASTPVVCPFEDIRLRSVCKYTALSEPCVEPFRWPCTLPCRFRASCRAKLLPQMGQEKGRTPVSASGQIWIVERSGWESYVSVRVASPDALSARRDASRAQRSYLEMLLLRVLPMTHLALEVEQAGAPF